MPRDAEAICDSATTFTDPVAKLMVIGCSLNDALFAVAAVGRSPAEHLLGRGIRQA
jgi:hypothetical protein